MLHFADTGDAYFTSMLLSDGFLARLEPMVGGRPVAFVPDRSALIVAADDPQSLPGLMELMERQFSEAPRGLSPMAYTCDESGRVVPYTASEPGRLADLIHRCEVMLAAGEYQSQKAALDEIHERDQKDIFVGTLLVAGRDDGTVFSVAVWSDECVTLLPRADLVCFQSDADSVMVPWPVVARTVGLKPEPGLMPERYLVTAWPEASLLEHLRAEAVTP
jgi:hypothetical protein